MIDMFKDIIKQRVHRNIFVKWRSNIQFIVQTQEMYNFKHLFSNVSNV